MVFQLRKRRYNFIVVCERSKIRELFFCSIIKELFFWSNNRRAFEKKISCCSDMGSGPKRPKRFIEGSPAPKTYVKRRRVLLTKKKREEGCYVMTKKIK